MGMVICPKVSLLVFVHYPGALFVQIVSIRNQGLFGKTAYDKYHVVNCIRLKR